jgi:low affinity Fe/Cu permease
MLSTAEMKRRLDYARFTHLTGMFMIAMFIYLFSTIPHKFWVLLTVLVVSAGIEPGLIVRRAIHRIGGTFSALTILIPLIYFMQLNYRLIPVVFILSIIGLAVTSLNPKRYDISVFFTTILIFLLLAQTTDLHSPEGPFVMVVNRAVCTLIGIAIILIGDYFLFQGYHYSHKLYLFHQRLVYNFFQDKLQEIITTKREDINTFIFLEKLRTEIIATCAPIAISSENLILQHQVAPQTKEKVQQFQDTVWDMRRALFAISISKFTLDTPELTEHNLLRLQQLLQKARQNFIKIPK